MEKQFLFSVAPQYREIFKNRTEEFKTANPESYYSMESLA